MVAYGSLRTNLAGTMLVNLGPDPKVLFREKVGILSSTCKAPASSGRWDNCDSCSVVGQFSEAFSFLAGILVSVPRLAGQPPANEVTLLRYCPFDVFGQLEGQMKSCHRCCVNVRGGRFCQHHRPDMRGFSMAAPAASPGRHRQQSNQMEAAVSCALDTKVIASMVIGCRGGLQVKRKTRHLLGAGALVDTPLPR